MKSKIRNMFKVTWVKFFPHKCLLPDVILSEGVNKLTRGKHFLWQQFLSTVWEMSVCRKCKHYSKGFICFIFVLWRVKVEVEVIWQSMWKCTWSRDPYFFFSDLRMFIGLLEYFDLSSVFNSNIVWFFIFRLSSTLKNVLGIFHPPVFNVNTKFSTFCLFMFILYVFNHWLNFWFEIFPFV